MNGVPRRLLGRIGVCMRVQPIENALKKIAAGSHPARYVERSAARDPSQVQRHDLRDDVKHPLRDQRHTGCSQAGLER